jgi:squalene-associated FAD-dependent desaturase
MLPTTQIIGAGLAGLSAAIRLAERGRGVALYEAAGQAGGRCRSYYDAGFGAVIDNGNHLLLSGNEAGMSYLKLAGSVDRLECPPRAEFAFADLATGERWTLKIDDGRWPAWLFDPARRVPGTEPSDYLGAIRLMWAGRRRTVTEVIEGKGALYRRLWQPLFLAALNTDPQEGSARLAGAIMRNTLAKGGAACRPLVAEGLSAAFIEPALGYIEARGGTAAFGRRLREIGFDGSRAAALDFGDGRIAIEAKDTVILAVPPWAAQALVPGLEAPGEFRAIVNAHYRIQAPPEVPKILGVINGTVEWVFAFPDRLSITISGADRLTGRPQEELAAQLWREVSGVTGLPAELPPWQIVYEKRRRSPQALSKMQSGRGQKQSGATFS